MTEEEAKQKWCPMVRITIGETDACDNRGNKNGDLATKCIASDCMMWAPEVDGRVGNIPTRSGKQGHCGLAGSK